MNQSIRGLLLVLLPLAALANSDVPTGKWIVSRHLDATEVSSSPTTLSQYKGKTLAISADSITFAGESCHIEKAHTIASDDEAKAFFLREYKADYAVLKLVAPLLVLDTDCNRVVSDSRKRLIFDWDGDFFDAKPLKPKRAH